GSPNADQCVGEVWIDPGISDDCSMIEDLRSDYKFDFFDDGIYDAFGYSDTYGPIYPFPNPNNLPVRRFEPADYAIRGFYPVGTHRILWAVEDGCGNSNICEYLLTIEDCKPPTAYCLPGISTIPMPSSAGGFIDIWASDFDLGSHDNCSDTSALHFAFSADPNDRSIRRTCDGDDTGQLESLTIYVFDEADNYSTCEVSLLLTDCRGQSQASISGAVALEEGEKMEDVMVHLEGYMNAAESTQTNGFFAFANLPTSHQYVVRPEKNTDPLNGISTYDLVLISKHVLGIENLDTPYKMIAADVNKSGNLTAFDLVELRKMILFIHTEFPNNSSWRFVPTNYIFSNLMDPFADAFPEVYRVDDLAEDMTADFIAIKTGDVNGSAIPNQAIASEERLASGGVLTFTTEDRLLEAGETYVVTIAAKPLASQLLGYQFTMGVDEKLVDVLDIQSLAAGLSSANFGTTLLDKGALTLSWHAGSKPIKLDERVFQLKLRAKRTTALSQVLNINSHYTKAEAYQAKNATDEPKYLSVELAFDTLLTTQPNGYELLPNNPNPFKNETTIGFVLPEAMTAKIVVYDLAGRISYEFSDNFEKGYNEWGLNRGEIGLGNMSAGVYYYSLIAKDFKATRRMIVIE
ncbi:MAG: T9SS type A sorting domain-containing protein, partial [Bacteroidota bacterium]